jgi:hypothetical protein
VIQTKIILNLDDPNGIKNAIKELKQYKKDFDSRVKLLLQKFIDNGISIARSKVIDFKIIHDNNLSNSINGFISGNVGFIRVDDKNAVFFEFGTGPRGASSPHPNGGSYKSEGWYTKADGKPMDTLYGWQPLGNDGDTYFYTKGQAAKPFMYETALELQRRIQEIKTEVFGA